MTNRPDERRAFEEHTGAKAGRFDGVARDYSMEDVKSCLGQYRSNTPWPGMCK